MWKSIFGESTRRKGSKARAAETVSEPDALAAKIVDLCGRLLHEQLARQTKLAQLQKMTTGKPKAVLHSVTCTRLLSSMRRHDSMITVYETSLSALEEMKTNLEAQRVSAETTQLLGRSHGHGAIDLEAVDNDMEFLEDLKHQRMELAGMMAGAGGGIGNDEYASMLELSFSEDLKPTEEETTTIPLLPSVPTQPLKPSKNTFTENTNGPPPTSSGSPLLSVF